MDRCLRCEQAITSGWKFCPNCGASTAEAAESPSEAAAAPAEKTSIHEEVAEPEAAPVTGAFSGLLFGLIAVPLLLIVGIMLCLTGLGAFLGVPMIIAALLAPLLGPLFGMGAAKGKVL